MPTLVEHTNVVGVGLTDSLKTRNLKRKRSSSLERGTPRFKLKPLPPAVLLVSLPALLAHPPNHPFHTLSLHLSLLSLRKCLSLNGLTPDIECRAWTGLAEIGMNIVRAGLSQHEGHTWAKGVEIEIEQALGKGLLLAQAHPSLRPFKHYLTLLHAHLAHWQHNFKFSRNLLRRLVASFSPNDPPHLQYNAHLTSITHALSTTPPDISTALTSLQAFQALSNKQADSSILLLTHVIRLRVLMLAGMWDSVSAALELAESALGLSYDSATPKPSSSQQKETTFVSFEEPFEASMAIHTLVMGVVYYTHTGTGKDASARLSHLHALLDEGTLEQTRQGIINIPLNSGPPLSIQVTHPRILYLLGFLVSAVTKRDAVGRRPKRAVFAREGLAMWDKEVRREIELPLWSGLIDAEEVDLRMAKIKADLLCELVAISIMRSEFDEAEDGLNQLIAHTRTYNIFPLFSARITLHHAHLAHALGHAARALECYEAAAYLAEKGTFVHVVARAGEVGIRIAISEMNKLDEQTRTEGEEVVKACQGMGGTLEAVGQVLQACLLSEIIKAKQHLKAALDLTSKTQDNHLRALILALIAAHYFHTSTEHALEMLATCGQLAAGLGAPASKDAPQGHAAVGNAPLGLWVGERFLELYKRAGKAERIRKQAARNAQLVHAVSRMAQRGMAGIPT